MVVVDRRECQNPLGNFFRRSYGAETIRFADVGHYHRRGELQRENLKAGVPRWSVCIPRTDKPAGGEAFCFDDDGRRFNTPDAV